MLYNLKQFKLRCKAVLLLNMLIQELFTSMGFFSLFPNHRSLRLVPLREKSASEERNPLFLQIQHKSIVGKRF